MKNKKHFVILLFILLIIIYMLNKTIENSYYGKFNEYKERQEIRDSILNKQNNYLDSISKENKKLFIDIDSIDLEIEKKIISIDSTINSKADIKEALEWIRSR